MSTREHTRKSQKESKGASTSLLGCALGSFGCSLLLPLCSIWLDRGRGARAVWPPPLSGRPTPRRPSPHTSLYGCSRFHRRHFLFTLTQCCTALHTAVAASMTHISGKGARRAQRPTPDRLRWGPLWRCSLPSFASVLCFRPLGCPCPCCILLLAFSPVLTLMISMEDMTKLFIPDRRRGPRHARGPWGAESETRPPAQNGPRARCAGLAWPPPPRPNNNLNPTLQS